MRKPGCSLIIATYNWPAALEKCLESVYMQRVVPNEIIIADDGSTLETKQLIDNVIKKSNVPVTHIWHKDEGFQLAKIRNKAFAAASQDYIIQIDGDIILHPHFIEDHLRLSKPGTFICGTRCLLKQELSSEIIAMAKPLALPVRDKRIDKKYNGYRNIPLSYLLYFIQRSQKNTKYVLGCNMAFWKNDLLTVNGYNEEFKGWGKEDNDLAIRLYNAGIKPRVIKFAGIIYHIYHKEASRENFSANETLLKETAAQGIIRIQQGIDQYSYFDMNTLHNSAAP
jgi:glycosyltransferase involved in cell wall biosynthesis